MLKAVVDINIFVSGLISKKGNPARLLQLWYDRAFLVVISEQMLEEFGRVLRYPHIRNKYNLKDEEIEQAVNTIEKFAIVLPDLIELDVIKDDPDDNGNIPGASPWRPSRGLLVTSRQRTGFAQY